MSIPNVNSNEPDLASAPTPASLSKSNAINVFNKDTETVKTQSVFSRMLENLTNNFLTNNRFFNISDRKWTARLVTGVAILAVAAGAFFGVWAYFGLAAGALSTAAYAGVSVFGLEMLTIAVRAKRQINNEVELAKPVAKPVAKPARERTGFSTHNHMRDFYENQPM